MRFEATTTIRTQEGDLHISLSGTEKEETSISLRLSGCRESLTLLASEFEGVRRALLAFDKGVGVAVTCTHDGGAE